MWMIHSLNVLKYNLMHARLVKVCYMYRRRLTESIQMRHNREGFVLFYSHETHLYVKVLYYFSQIHLCTNGFSQLKIYRHIIKIVESNKYLFNIAWTFGCSLATVHSSLNARPSSFVVSIQSYWNTYLSCHSLLNVLNFSLHN